ncbi:MAG: 4-(cytidine 5'-diphospho)-2-C-methyl-D-erythritol kinase [Bacteroidia bacterium]|nr:4-(cytidine 5'-diphospho)-2-C-methyl-D-erythritol kinase [Bacteroidia bacterium]
MLVFPNAKINLGLHILNKREDGYHNLETIFYPIPLSDSLEMIVNPTSDTIQLSNFGIQVEGDTTSNLVTKAFKLIQKKYGIPGVNAALLKNIPTGAGLGGGSSDGAFALKLLNKLFSLDIPQQELENLALELGSDCPFFISNQAVFAQGRGEIFSPVQVQLKGFWFVLIKPEIHVSTAQAFSRVSRRGEINPENLKQLVEAGVHHWKGELTNDFEPSVFAFAPELAEIKEALYSSGAIYASMSGSGSSVYGIFNSPIHLKDQFKNCFYFEGFLN